MPLTDTAIRSAKPREKPFKLSDAGGLYLEVAPSGGKWWRLKFRFGGKEKRISLGVYPDVGLKDARERRDQARRLLANGVDPGAQRKAARAAGAVRAGNSFEAIATEWFAKQKPAWAASHASKILLRLENDVLPWLGPRPIAEITAPEILSVLRRIESRGAVESAHRVLQNINQIFRYAIATARAERNPAADLAGALSAVAPKHLAAITDPKAIGGLLRAIEAYEGTFVTRSALSLAPHLFVRPGELRHAEWSEFDLDAAEWNIAASKMKMKMPHLVPLSDQALSILNDLRPLTGEGKFVFPSARSDKRPMSDNAILSALRRMGFAKEEMSGHGFRAMARTVLDEVLGFRPDFIEHQLAHAVRDPNGRAYNRTAHLAERRKMMQAWSNYLDGLRQGVVEGSKGDQARSGQRR